MLSPNSLWWKALPFKLSFKRKVPSPKASPYPLSLGMTEVNSLKELLRSPGWPAYRSLLERYANLRAQRLLQPLPLDQTNVERGAIAALFEIAALPDQLVKHIGDSDARANANSNAESGTPDFSWAWGNSLFADRFRHP